MSTAPVAATIPKPRATITPQPQGAALVRVLLLADILMACEDQAKSQCITLEEWLQATIPDVLQSYLGG